LPEKEELNNKARPFRFLILFAVLTIFTVDCFDCVWATASVNVSPSSTIAGAGQSFSVNLTVSDVLDLYGWEFKLNWSAAYLDVMNIIEGSFLRNGGETFFTFRFDNAEGHLIADGTLLGNVFGVTGTGVLATVTFYVKAAGESVLDLYYVTFLDSSYPEPQTMLCQTAGGYWLSLPEHDVSVADMIVSPMTVLPGQIVSINITVQNDGAYVETFNVATYVGLISVGELQTTLDPGCSTVLQFTWDTSGWSKGEYVVSSSASIVPGEIDLEDNNKTAYDKVTILTPGHDVAVVNIAGSKTVVCQGFCMYVNVTVKNFGTYVEMFSAITYANETVLNTTSVILGSGYATVLPLVWNTSSFVKGQYTIRSHAEPVVGETDTTDNTFYSGSVIVSKKGDISGRIQNIPDGDVDIADVSIVARAFGTSLGNAHWNANADFSGVLAGLPDNEIDIKDVSTVAKCFGT
jgi:hypothetical protein